MSYCCSVPYRSILLKLNQLFPLLKNFKFKRRLLLCNFFIGKLKLKKYCICYYLLSELYFILQYLFSLLLYIKSNPRVGRKRNLYLLLYFNLLIKNLKLFLLCRVYMVDSCLRNQNLLSFLINFLLFYYFNLFLYKLLLRYYKFLNLSCFHRNFTLFLLSFNCYLIPFKGK